MTGSDPDERREAELVREAKRGGREAMDLLVRMHQDRVFAVLRRSVPAAEVEDLAQEAFLRAFREIDRYRGESRFGTWLFRIVRNLLIDRHRRLRRTPPRVGFAEESGERGDAVVADPGPGPDDASAHAALRARLDRALARLDERDRIAILLHDGEGMSGSEVARVVGGSEGALRVRLFRARRRLRAWLEEEEVR